MDANFFEKTPKVSKVKFIFTTFRLLIKFERLMLNNDDSHQYSGFNYIPPFGADDWGIIVYTDHTSSKSASIKLFILKITLKSWKISQIIRVGDNAFI